MYFNLILYILIGLFIPSSNYQCFIFYLFFILYFQLWRWRIWYGDLIDTKLVPWAMLGKCFWKHFWKVVFENYLFKKNIIYIYCNIKIYLITWNTFNLFILFLNIFLKWLILIILYFQPSLFLYNYFFFKKKKIFKKQVIKIENNWNMY